MSQIIINIIVIQLISSIKKVFWVMWMSVHKHFAFIFIQFEHWISYCLCQAMKELSLYSLSAKVLTSVVFVNVDDYVGKCSHYHLFVNNMQLGPET